MNVGKWLKTVTAMGISCWVAMPGPAQSVDYFEANRAMIRNGVQAVLTCNGLFTSERTLDQVFAEELAYLGERVIGTSSDGNYLVDLNRKGVLVGGDADGVQIGAVFREGIGCVVMPPGLGLAATAFCMFCQSVTLTLFDLGPHFWSPTSGSGFGLD